MYPSEKLNHHQDMKGVKLPAAMEGRRSSYAKFPAEQIDPPQPCPLLADSENIFQRRAQVISPWFIFCSERDLSRERGLAP